MKVSCSGQGFWKYLALDKGSESILLRIRVPKVSCSGQECCNDISLDARVLKGLYHEWVGTTQQSTNDLFVFSFISLSRFMKVSQYPLSGGVPMEIRIGAALAYHYLNVRFDHRWTPVSFAADHGLAPRKHNKIRTTKSDIYDTGSL
jgi:hypothetical protein